MSQTLKMNDSFFHIKRACKNMGKTALVAPLYISVAWTLLISYQLFTQTAVSTVVTHIKMIWPFVGEWLVYRMDVIVFIYAFAWIFLLSSVIPSFILGKQRSVLIQFVVCLTLAFAAFEIQDLLIAYELGPFNHILGLTALFQNPVFAAIYLLTPYLLMLFLDLRSRRRCKEDEEFERIKALYMEQAAVTQ
jgi:hypothetical protein